MHPYAQLWCSCLHPPPDPAATNKGRKFCGVECAASADFMMFSEMSFQLDSLKFLAFHASWKVTCTSLCSSCSSTSETHPSKAAAHGGGLSCPKESSSRLCVMLPEQSSRYPSSFSDASASPSATCIWLSRLECSETCTTGTEASGKIRARGDQHPKSKARIPSNSHSIPPVVRASAILAAQSGLPLAMYCTWYRHSAKALKSCAVLGLGLLMIFTLLSPSETHRDDTQMTHEGFLSG
mmetsp:Transcript_56446/g.138547  ORF Transcript_56446/g.138547 Transcript_56446/m.138547 type:complete len:238 (+) Transcript_56446:100-813(+)